MDAADSNEQNFTPRAVIGAGALVPLAQQFLRMLRLRNYRPNTLAAYKVDLEQLVGYLATRDVAYAEHITAPLLDDWVSALVHGHGMQPRSAARKVETAKRFLGWAEVRGAVLRNPSAGMTPVRFHAEPVMAPEHAVLMRVLDSVPRDTPIGLRDYAMLRVMYDGALRVGALVSLDLHDPVAPPVCRVDPTGIVYYRRKGGDVGEAAIDDATLAALGAYLAVRDTLRAGRDEAALFLSTRHGRITRHQVADRLRQLGEAAGVPGLHPHLLRHRRLGDMLERDGLDTAFYQSGHRNRSTTVDVYGLPQRERMRHRIRQTCSLDRPPC